MESGEWKVESGKWRVVNPKAEMIIGLLEIVTIETFHRPVGRHIISPNVKWGSQSPSGAKYQ